MNSTKIFNKLSYEIKNKIYKKYSLDFEEIKSTIQQALVNIYGVKYSKVIEQKLNQIYFVNFFENLDLFIYFQTDSKTFTPKILDSTKESNSTDLDEQTKKIAMDLEKFFGNDENLQYERIYDADVIHYNNLLTEYLGNLYSEYSSITKDGSLSPELCSKKNLEYDINSSMYSCFIKEISKINLLLDSDFLYKNLKNLLFLQNSCLVSNVNSNFEKSDIIVINPIKFSDKDVFDLIHNIISSINTDLLIDKNNVFTFNRGLNDCFIKHNFNQGIEYDNRKYRLLIDFIYKSLTFEVIDYIKNNNLNIFGYTTFPTLIPYLQNASVFSIFYNSYKELLLESILTKNTKKLFERIGEKNFIDFVEVSFEYMEVSKHAYLHNENYTIEDNPLIHSLFFKREALLESMENYNK